MQAIFLENQGFHLQDTHYNFAIQRKKALSAHYTSEQILLFLLCKAELVNKTVSAVQQC